MNVRILSVAVAGSLLSATLIAQQGRVGGAPPAPAPAQGAPAQGQGGGRGAGGGGGQAAGPAMRPMRIYIRGGLKTHGPGQHDYPQYLADWSKVLTERGAIVDGSLHFPTADELRNIDVIITYKGDAGYMTANEKATLETYLKGGGGMVGLHDAICAEDAEWFSTIFGGAKKHGETNFTLEAEVPYTIVDETNPIVQGMKPFTITDEAFFLMTWAKNAQGQPLIKPLVNATIAGTPSAGTHKGEVVPQVWTYERSVGLGGQPYRAFVWMQGHNYSNFVDPNVQPMLLKGIAWAARYPVDALMTVRPAAGGGGRGRAGGGGQ